MDARRQALQAAAVVLWPSQSFDLDDYLADGTLKPGIAHRLDRADPVELFCAIMHHE